MATHRRGSRPPRTSVWLEESPAPKRRQGEGGAGLDRERITAAAVRLLDADGIAAFSMRRLAAEVGVTAMSVYWHVSRKDEVLELALDAVHGELRLPDPDEESADWRAQLRELAYECRALCHAHPWVSGMLGTHLNIGPHARALAGAARGVLRRAGLPPHLLTGALSALFPFVFGFAAVESSWNARSHEAGLGADAYASVVPDGVRDRPGAGDHGGGDHGGGEDDEDVPQPAQERGDGTAEKTRERDFAVALDCVLAGIEALRPPPGAPA